MSAESADYAVSYNDGVVRQLSNRVAASDAAVRAMIARLIPVVFSGIESFRQLSVDEFVDQQGCWSHYSGLLGALCHLAFKFGRGEVDHYDVLNVVWKTSATTPEFFRDRARERLLREVLTKAGEAEDVPGVPATSVAVHLPDLGWKVVSSTDEATALASSEAEGSTRAGQPARRCWICGGDSGSRKNRGYSDLRPISAYVVGTGEQVI